MKKLTNKMKNSTFNDFKKYTDTVEVNCYTWTKNLFTISTENIFPKWQYLVPQNKSGISILLRYTERDLKPKEIVKFIWKENEVEIINPDNNASVTIPLDTIIESKDWAIFLDNDSLAVIDVMTSVLDPLKIS